MAKYCSNCGRKLEDGEVCECKKKMEFNIQGNKIVELCKNVFIKPVETIKDFKEEKNFSLSVIMVLVTSIIFGFFCILVTKVFYKTSVALYARDMYNTNYMVDYYSIFIVGIVIALIYCFLSAFILYLINNKIFNVEINYKNSFNITSPLLIFDVVGILLSIIALPVSIYIVGMVILFACMLKVICLTLIEKEVFKLNNTKSIYANLIYVIAITVVISIIISQFN